MTMIWTYRLNDSAVQMCIIQDVTVLSVEASPFFCSSLANYICVFRCELCAFAHTSACEKGCFLAKTRVIEGEKEVFFLCC